MQNDPRSVSSNALKVAKTRRLSIEKDLRARAVRADVAGATGQDAPKTENLRQRWQTEYRAQLLPIIAQYRVSLLQGCLRDM